MTNITEVVNGFTLQFVCAIRDKVHVIGMFTTKCKFDLNYVEFEIA